MGARELAPGTRKVWNGRRTRRTCVELVVELVVFYVVLVELVKFKDFSGLDPYFQQVLRVLRKIQQVLQQVLHKFYEF